MNSRAKRCGTACKHNPDKTVCDCRPRFAWHDFEVVLMSGRRSAYIVVKVKVNFTRGRGVTMTLFDRPVAVMSLP